MLVDFSGLKKQQLLTYSCSSGGDMNGGHYSETVKLYDDEHALITVSESSWYFEDPAVAEYFVDKSILDEIKDICLKYGMQRWDGKQISNIFIADGASTSYRFDFEDDDFWFSSQYYPESYSSKLIQIKEVIKKYKATGEKLPGLIVPEMSEEQKHKLKYPDDGNLGVRVCEYSSNYLYYNLTNGTDDEVEFVGSVTLKKADGTVIYSKEDGVDVSASRHSVADEAFKLTERLDAGTYLLSVGEYECQFEIGETANQ